jgi:hypothetical protein
VALASTSGDGGAAAAPLSSAKTGLVYVLCSVEAPGPSCCCCCCWGWVWGWAEGAALLWEGSPSTSVGRASSRPAPPRPRRRGPRARRGPLRRSSAAAAS